MRSKAVCGDCGAAIPVEPWVLCRCGALNHLKIKIRSNNRKKLGKVICHGNIKIKRVKDLMKELNERGIVIVRAENNKP